MINNFISGEERYKEQLRLANNSNGNRPNEIIQNENKITKNEPDDPELPVPEVPEEKNIYMSDIHPENNKKSMSPALFIFI